MSTQELKNETAVSPFLVLDTPVEEIREAFAANLGDGGVNLEHLVKIKMPTGGGTIWTIETEEGPKNTPEIEGIVLFCRDTRAFWRHNQGGGRKPPDCQSTDSVTGVGDPGGDCRRCQLAQFGPNRERPACTPHCDVFLVQRDKYLPDIVQLPPTSVKIAHQYIAQLTKPCHSVVTKIRLERVPNQGNAYSVAKFAAGTRLAPEQAIRMKEYVEMMGPIRSAPAAPMLIAAALEQGGVEII